MSKPYEVYQYNIEKLIEFFVKKSKSNYQIISNKIHKIYFEEYFAKLNAKTMLIENDYIDRDYLEDFSNYYVRCFTEYKKKCTRFHFFSFSFNEDEFENIISKTNLDSLGNMKESYLGFIVLKPLPQTIIGKTCLKPYPKEKDKERNYPVLRKYSVSLFGIDLSVESLAFQEQDNVVAACATSALWSVFNSTGILFHHQILSPAEITKEATKQLPIESRIFPNKGLTLEQMAHAIQSVGLEPFLIGGENSYFYFKSYINAYLRFGIPILLGITLFDISGEELKFIGKHAVAITGFRIDKSIINDFDIDLKSSRINRIYVHDDQIGPFARMIFDENTTKVKKDNKKIDMISLSTSWKYNGADIGNIKAIPEILLVPLYHKIRIPLDRIYKYIYSFQAILNNLKAFIPHLISNNIEWNIYLIGVNELKKELFNNIAFKSNYCKKILLKNLPRFIWRATAVINNKLIMDLLFDATDIEQGNNFIYAIEYDEMFSLILRNIFKETIIEEKAKREPVWEIIKWFIGK